MEILGKISVRVCSSFACAFTLALGLGMSGCALEGGGSGEEVIATSHDELTTFGGGEVGQFSHQSKVFLGTAFNSSCYLTKVGGSFQGTGEWVKIEKISGNWYLSYGSQQGGNLNASARCVYYPESVTKSWSKGMSSVPLQVGGTCFLTGLTGKFAGGGEAVNVWKDSHDQWWINGTSQTNQGLGGTATCINKTNLGNFSNWAKSSWDIGLVADKAVPARSCFLQSITGALSGAGEQIEVSNAPTSSGSLWILHGQSGSQQGKLLIGANAGCTGGANAGLP